MKLIHLNYHDQLKAAEDSMDTYRMYSLIFDIKKIIIKEQPDAIITWGPDGVTTHMDHRLVGASVTQVYLSQIGASQLIFTILANQVNFEV